MQLVNEQVNVGEYEEVKIGEGEGINISVEFTGKNIFHFLPVRPALVRSALVWPALITFCVRVL